MHACPLQNKCMSKDIVYKATVIKNHTQDTKHYTGMTSNTFKERYRNHIKSFTQKIFKRNGTFETRLALKTKQNRFHHKMVNNKKIYFLHTGGSKRCNLCLEEKLSILKEKDNCLLNKRLEIVWPTNTKINFR